MCTALQELGLAKRVTGFDMLSIAEGLIRLCLAQPLK